MALTEDIDIEVNLSILIFQIDIKLVELAQQLKKLLNIFTFSEDTCAI